MRRQLTSTYSYYVNYVFTLLIALVLIGVSKGMMDKDSWPYAAVFAAGGMLMLYSLIFLEL